MPPQLISIIIKSVLILMSVSIVLIVYNWKRSHAAYHFLAYYLCWNLFIELLVQLFSEFGILSSNNLPLLHLSTWGQFILFTLMYKKMGIFDKFSDRQFWLFLGSVSLLLILNSIFLQSIYKYNTHATTLVQVILIAYSVSFMFQLTEKPSSLNLLNAAVLISNSGSLFVFMFGNVLLADEFDTLFWEINLILNLLFQILILISIWKASRVKKLQF